jgi:hypothetical protein
MAYTLVSSINISGTAIDSWTSSASPVDTTGVDLITIGVCSADSAGATPPDADSKGNAYTLAKTKSNSLGGSRAAIYYKQNPTVGSGHYWSLTTTGHYYSIAVRCWSGSVSSPLDTSSGDGQSTTGATTCALTSVTPTVDNCLVLAAWAINESVGYSVTAPLTELNEVGWVNNVNIGLETGYVIQTATTAITATATFAVANQVAGVCVAFKAAAVTAATALPVPLNIRQAVPRASLW